MLIEIFCKFLYVFVVLLDTDTRAIRVVSTKPIVDRPIFSIGLYNVVQVVGVDGYRS